MVEINLINKIFILFFVLFDYLTFFKFSKNISKLDNVKKSKKIICASILILINLIFSYFFNYSYVGYMLIILNLIFNFIYLKIIYKNSLIEDIILAFTYRITAMVCSHIIYLSIDQLDKYMKLPWLISEYVPGILSVIVTYLFTIRIAIKLINFKKCNLKIKEFYFLLSFCLCFLVIHLIFFDHSSAGFITVWISIICLISNIALFYYKDEKQKKLMAEKELVIAEKKALIAKQEALQTEKEALQTEKEVLIAEKETAKSKQKVLQKEKEWLITNIGKILFVLLKKEEQEKEFIAEKENLISQIQDLLSENEELMFKIDGLKFENEDIFKHREIIKREIINILKENVKPVIEGNLVLQKENLKSIIEENLALQKENLKYEFQIQKMSEKDKSKDQRVKSNFKNFLDYLLSCEDIETMKNHVNNLKKEL